MISRRHSPRQRAAFAATSWFLVLALISCATAHDLGWEEIRGISWQGQQTATGAFDLDGGLVQSALPKEKVEGHWVRVTATAPESSPDFNVWIHVFDSKMRPLTRPLPTRCKRATGKLVCRNEAWIVLGGASVRASFYPKSAGSLVMPGVVEIGDDVPPKSTDIKRLDAILASMKQLYFRTDEVNWVSLRALGLRALHAPAGFDPLPGTVSVLVSQLPDRTHSMVYRTTPEAQIVAKRPSCVKLAPGNWRLDLPATPLTPPDQDVYLRDAHLCLATRGVRSWLIDLTANQGGDTSLEFAALAPILRTGPQMMYTAPNAKQFAVSIHDNAVWTDSSAKYRWRDRFTLYQGRVTFLISAGCGSACEAVAIAVKGRYALLGQLTAGYTTANESVRINNDFSVAISSGHMADLCGNTPERIVPDTILSDEAMQTLRTHGSY